MSTPVHATRYGAEALTTLRCVVADLKGDDPMQLVTIIVPSNLVGISARRHLAQGVLPGTTGVAGLEISTLPRLAERLAAHTLAPRRPATTPVVATAWRGALESDPGVFADVVDHPSTLRALVDAHRELRDLDDAALDAVASTGPLARDVVRLHRQASATIAAGWYDTTDLLDAATAGVDAISTPVVLYLRQDLTQAEARFARALGTSTSVTIIAGLTGTQRSDEIIHRTLERLGHRVETTVEPPLASRVLNASDADDEVRCVVREVTQTLRSTKAHRIAVLYSAADPYARLLHEHFAAASLTINGPGIRNVDERAIARAFLDIMALGDLDLPRAELFRVLALAPTRTFDGERIPLSRWERISRAAGVVAGDDWLHRIDQYAAARQQAADKEAQDPDREWLADRHRRDASDATDLQSFVLLLRERLADAQRLDDWTRLSTWARDLFTSLYGEPESLRHLPVEEQQAAADVLRSAAGVGALTDAGGPASFRALRDILDLDLGAALPRVGKFGEGILVAPISSGVGLDVDVLYVVGLSEDLYPGRAREDAVLSASARAAADGALRTVRDQVNRKMTQLYAAMASAETVVATFARGDLRRSTQRIPSRWLLPSLRHLSGNHSLPATQWQDAAEHLSTSSSFAGELLSTVTLASEQEWRTRAAAADQLDDTTVSAAQAMDDARHSEEFTRFDGNLSGVTGLPDYASGSPAVSPTALESYAACPHAFFVQRLLGVRQLEQPEDTVEISASDVGTLMHACLDQLVQELKASGGLPGFGEPWTDEHRRRLLEIGEGAADDYERQGLTGHPTLWEGDRRRILADLLAMLDADDDWRAEVGARVVDAELAFGLNGADPVSVPVPSGVVTMRGSADKIDIGSDGTLYVTDVKTGSARTFTTITQDAPLSGGTKLQLPVYAHAAREQIDVDVERVATAYWFVRRDLGRIGIEMTPEVEQLYAETLDVIVRSIGSGLFPPKAPAEPDFAWVQCDYCNPDGIGHAENRERWERKRHDAALHDLVQLIDADALALQEDDA